MSHQDETFKDLYSRVPSVRDPAGYHRCFYCGEPADALDHCPPLSRVSDYRSLGLAHERYWIVPCCGECNNLLGKTLQPSLGRRHDVCKRLLYAKLHRKLDVPEWTEEELEDFGPRLRHEVEAAQRVALRADARLAYDQGLDLWLRSLDL